MRLGCCRGARGIPAHERFSIATENPCGCKRRRKGVAFAPSTRQVEAALRRRFAPPRGEINSPPQQAAAAPCSSLATGPLCPSLPSTVYCLLSFCHSSLFLGRRWLWEQPLLAAILQEANSGASAAALFSGRLRPVVSRRDRSLATGTKLLPRCLRCKKRRKRQVPGRRTRCSQNTCARARMSSRKRAASARRGTR